MDRYDIADAIDDAGRYSLQIIFAILLIPVWVPVLVIRAIFSRRK